MLAHLLPVSIRLFYASIIGIFRLIIKKISFFEEIRRDYLRMCIFCCTFAANFLGKSGQNIMFFLEKTDIMLFYLKEKTDKICVII